MEDMENNEFDDYLRVSVTEIAYQKIKDLIYANKFAPGEKLNKRIISEKLHLSSTPITLALKRLWGEGFIYYRSRIGFFVKKFSDEELIEFFELRASLESIAVRLAIENNSLEQLQDIIRYWEHYTGTSKEEYVAADNIFHEKIIVLSKSALIVNTWKKLGCDIKINQKGLQNYLEDSKRDHKAIIKAIQGSDAIKAQLLMADHFINAANYVRQRIKKRKETEQY